VRQNGKRTHFEDEVVETLLVDGRQGLFEFQRKVHEQREVRPFRGSAASHNLTLDFGVQPTCGHVGRADRLDFDDHLFELRPFQYLQAENTPIN